MEHIEWHTHEYLHTEKTVDWYWIVSIVAISIAVIAIILNNIIFAILVIVSAFALMLLASRRPQIIRVELGKAGVTMGNKLYPYEDLQSFWVEVSEFHPRVIIKSKKALSHLTTIIINADDVHHEDIKNFLAKHLPEEKLSEPFLEKLLIRLGF